MTFKIAFFKGSGRIGDKLIRWWTRGPYSHCEFIFSDGMAGAATVYDGVVVRSRNFDPNDWDFIELPASLEAKARQWFVDHEGKAYDFVGDLRFIFGFMTPSKDKWFCSRACADALGMGEAWRYDPNMLAWVLRSIAMI